MTRYEERAKFIELKARADEITAKYNWYDEKVYPYSWPERIGKILDECTIENYDNSTRGSQNHLYLLIKVLVEILEEREATELTRIWVIIRGERRKLAREVVEYFIEEGIDVQILEEK